MKLFKHIGFIAFVSLFAFACKNEAQPEVKTIDTEIAVNSTLDPNANYAKAEFGIDGMTCAMGCAKTIEKKLAKMDGVKSAKVDFGKKIAMVEYDEAKVSSNLLEETVKKVSEVYSVHDMKKVDSFSSEEQE